MSPISTPSGIARSAVQPSSAASPTAGCSARVAIVLAGRGATTRTVALSTALGLPVAALPINSERNLVECWVKRMAEGGFRGHVVLAITSESERAFYSALQAPPGITLQVQVDTSWSCTFRGDRYIPYAYRIGSAPEILDSVWVPAFTSVEAVIAW